MADNSANINPTSSDVRKRHLSPEATPESSTKAFKADAIEDGERDSPRGKATGKRKKYAMLVAYCGTGYHGMQINGDTPTIERELFGALAECGLADKEQSDKYTQHLHFQRAARTDKNVSAVKQVCSLLLGKNHQGDLNDSMLSRLNDVLPATIRILKFIRTTTGFNSMTNCDSRTYSYVLPTFALAPSHDIKDTSYRITESQIARVDSLLSKFKGTKNFFNFTSGRPANDKSLMRYIISFECEKPFVMNEAEFVTIKVKGQSFMIHQIRKMIGIMIAVVRNLTQESIIDEAFDNKKKVDVPKAPGLGLLLEQVHYDSYNRKFQKTHDAVDWSDIEEKVQTFRRDVILRKIVETEIAEKSMEQWLSTLDKHSFTSSAEEALLEKNDQEKC